jgi:hypothetical protein
MADKKITELTSWTTPIATDVLPIVDITAGATKKIAYSDLTKGQVAANGAIVAATKTKITYDTKGLVTVGADATTADIADSLNARYCTDAEKVVIGNTSNSNTGDQTLPVKATGAELDTATDDAKFATALAIKNALNVPSVAPSTLGNVMTSDGTNWTSATAPAGGDVLMVQVFT